jgi:hypothetical protein
MAILGSKELVDKTEKKQLILVADMFDHRFCAAVSELPALRR